MDIFNITFLIILMIATYTDIKNRIISNKLMLSSFILGIILNIYYKSYSYIIVSLILFLILTFSPIKGGGDVKLLSIASLYVRYKLGSFFYILSIVSLILLITYKLMKKSLSRMPLAPYVLITHILNEIFFIFQY